MGFGKKSVKNAEELTLEDIKVLEFITTNPGTTVRVMAWRLTISKDKIHRITVRLQSRKKIQCVRALRVGKSLTREFYSTLHPTEVPLEIQVKRSYIGVVK